MKRLGGTVPFLRYWLPVYLYAGLIFFGSSLSSPPIRTGILYGDKLLHLVEYAIFGFLIARAVRNSPRLRLQVHFRIFAVCAAVLYGISDELHQYFVPGREAEILDVVVDGLGGFFGQMFLRG